MARGLVIGVVATLVAILLVAYFGIVAGLMPANADGKPWKIERWAARKSLSVTIAREMPKTPNPVTLDDANLIAGIKLYAQDCVMCHGASNGNASNIARGLYQHPPQLAKDGVEDDPEGETYWKITHGIRFTGMPSFGGTLNDTQVWQLTLFLKHMDGLPKTPEGVWKAVRNPAAAAAGAGN
jgi:mono/diheme cytochrome c family protein